MNAAAEPLKITQDLIDSEILECPALAPFYAAAKRLGKIIVDESGKACEENVNGKPKI